MERILYYDYCALLILLILLVTTIYRGMSKVRVQRIFLLLLVLGLLCTAADIGAILLERMGKGHIVLKYTAHNLYLIFHCLSIPVYMMYLILLSETDHRVKAFQKMMFVIPFLVVLVVTILNPWHKMLYHFDQNGVYTRGSLFWILYMSVFLSIGLGFFHLARQKKHHDRDLILSLCSIFPLMFGAMIMQYFYAEIRCEMLANALGLMLLSCLLQRPEQYIDTITGFGKESAYALRMERILSNEKPCTVIMINLKNFDSLHNMLGYANVCKLIRAIAGKFSQINAKHGFRAEMYYLGGGKFRMLLNPRYGHRADELATKINQVLKEGLSIQEMHVNLVSMVCVVQCVEQVKDFASMIVFGNELSKYEYTGQVLHASDIYQKEHYDLMKDIDEVIEYALCNNTLEVYYQPIYCVKEDRYRSAEALLRLKDEKYGFVSPDIFITEAEKSGAIHRIGSYVLEEVCKFIASLEFKELGLDYIEINLSVVQCMRSDLAEEVLAIMHKYGVKSEQINLEITETAASYSQEVLSDNIKRLNEQGIRLSLDDYGTGYSNMRRIASMPFDLIKLDRSFALANQDSKMRIVLENTIRMIKAMDMKIVVEGIETAQLANQFAQLECEYIQGFYYARPVNKQDFIAFLKEKQKGK